MRIHITGGAGFVGSNLVRRLNELGEVPVIYDDLDDIKWRYLRSAKFIIREPYLATSQKISPDDILVHLGANVNTKEKMSQELWRHNVEYTENLFHSWNLQGNYKLIYASSAAVYGNESVDFSPRTKGLKPLNPYAMTKLYLDNNFGEPQRATALRFFNVYGANELHKGEMASVVSKAIISRKLAEDRYFLYQNPENTRTPMRDFIHVDDVCSVILFFAQKSQLGIFNVGTGKAEPFENILKALNFRVEYVKIPENLKEQYQYFTEANLDSLRQVGYNKSFRPLSVGVLQTEEAYREFILSK